MAIDFQSVSGVAAWRRAQRASLLAARRAMSAAEHRRASRAIMAVLETELAGWAEGALGFYWPIQQEFDARPLIERLIAGGATAALPVITERGGALTFRRWQPGMVLASGAYGIPFPTEGEPLLPVALLVPLLGFDAAGYRLGYGGGYYDRTLAALRPRPRSIGIGFELGRLATIFPQAHDQPMDCIISEAGIVVRDGHAA